MSKISQSQKMLPLFYPRTDYARTDSFSNVPSKCPKIKAFATGYFWPFEVLTSFDVENLSPVEKMQFSKALGITNYLTLKLLI